MHDNRCRACDTEIRAGSRYCPSCGVSQSAEFVGLTMPATNAPNEEMFSGGSGSADDPAWRRVLVPLSVVGLLAVLAVVLLQPGGQPDDESVAEPTPRTTPTTFADSLPTATPTSPPPPTPTPLQSPTSVVLGSPALTPRPLEAATTTAETTDGSPLVAADIPETEATHLAVVQGQAVFFLDLATATWRTQTVGRAATGGDRPVQFGDGVMVARGRQALAVGLTGGVVPIATAGEFIVGISASVAIVVAPDAQTIRALDPAGELLWERSVQAPHQVVGVTAGGAAVVQSGTQVLLVDEAGERVIATGSAIGAIGNFVAMFDCDRLNQCNSFLIDVATGGRLETPGLISYTTETFFAIPDDTTGEIRPYVVIDGVVSVTNDPTIVDLTTTIISDGSGALAQTTDAGVLLIATDGTAVEVGLPFTAECCSRNTRLAFLTVIDE